MRGLMSEMALVFKHIYLRHSERWTVGHERCDAVALFLRCNIAFDASVNPHVMCEELKFLKLTTVMVHSNESAGMHRTIVSEGVFSG